jgi:hypothetical protein
MIDELKQIKSGPAQLREFGVTMGAILIVLGDIALWRGRGSYPYLLGVGIVFSVLAFARPGVLKPFQKAWMELGIIIGFFVSRIILAVVFYAIMTPISLGMRLFGKDLLNERIDKKRISYWLERPAAITPRESYENQY